MTKRILRVKVNFLIAVTLLCLTAQFALAQETKPFSINESPLPAPTAPVNDFAGVLDEATKARLNQRLIQLRDGTNPRVELAVAVVKTTGERPIFDYTLAVARGWKIGSKEDDNPSALLLIAIDDRKYFTQVSKDLQDELPDGLVGQLQRQYLVPAFKQGDYGKGISDTIEAYIREIEEKGNAVNPTTGNTQRPQQQRGKGGLGGICNFVTCLIILFVLMIIIFSRGGGGRGGTGRSGRGGGGGFGSALPWIILGSGLGGGGSSSSSGWGGSSGGSGGDSWGGFGGGGDFDGGGAGGDW